MINTFCLFVLNVGLQLAGVMYADQEMEAKDIKRYRTFFKVMIQNEHIR